MKGPYTFLLTVTVEADNPVKAYRKMVHAFFSGQPPAWSSEGVNGPNLELHGEDYSRWFVQNMENLDYAKEEDDGS